MMEDDLQPHRYSHTPYFSTQRTPLDSNIHPDIVNNCQKCMKNRSGCSQVCIIAPLFHTRYLFTLKKPTPKRNVNTSTFTLDHSVCLCWSCWGSGGRSPNCLWDKKKKKGADLLLNWPHSVDREYQVIELIHAAFSCLGKMICSYCLPSAVDQGHECVRNVETRDNFLCRFQMSKCSNGSCEKNSISSALQTKYQRRTVSAFHL